ncbi:MAG: hypothetical protein ACLUD0_08240 [Eubacterium ramulus]
MDFSQIKNHLISHREHAQHQIDYIKAHRHMEEDELHTYIYDYVLYKYNLFGEVADVYVLDDLAELSVAKAIKLSKERAIAYDNKASCDGATSAMNKKVLLLMAIQKELNIKFPLDEVVQIKDTKKLTSVVYRQLNGKMAD